MKPQPHRGLVIITVCDELFGRRIDAEEPYRSLANLQGGRRRQRPAHGILSSYGDGPFLAVVHVSDCVFSGVSGQSLAYSPCTVSSIEDYSFSCLVKIPYHLRVIAGCFLNLRHCETCHTGCSLAGVTLHHSERHAFTLRHTEYVSIFDIRVYLTVYVCRAAGCFRAEESASVVKTHFHLSIFGCCPRPHIVITDQLSGNFICIKQSYRRSRYVVVLVLT